MVGLFKHTFYKVIGGGMLTWSEVSEVVLDVKIHPNRRPIVCGRWRPVSPSTDPAFLPIPKTYLSAWATALERGTLWSAKTGKVPQDLQRCLVEALDAWILTGRIELVVNWNKTTGYVLRFCVRFMTARSFWTWIFRLCSLLSLKSRKLRNG